jgi:hypothetical protein
VRTVGQRLAGLPVGFRDLWPVFVELRLGIAELRPSLVEARLGFIEVCPAGVELRYSGRRGSIVALFEVVPLR